MVLRQLVTRSIFLLHRVEDSFLSPVRLSSSQRSSAVTPLLLNILKIVEDSQSLLSVILPMMLFWLQKR